MPLRHMFPELFPYLKRDGVRLRWMPCGDRTGENPLAVMFNSSCCLQMRLGVVCGPVVWVDLTGIRG